MMKILSYNINKCNQSKIDRIISLGADIMVLPAFEIGRWDKAASDHCPQMIVF